MILLCFALSLLSVLRLSECALIFHQDCDHYRDILTEKFGKSQARLRALGQEMYVLSNVRTPNAQGNTGLQNAASLLFDPLINFYTIYTSASDVATSVAATLIWGERITALTNSDTIVRCSEQGLVKMKKNTYIDNTLNIAIAQDPINVQGLATNTLNMYVTVPPVEQNLPSIIRISDSFLFREVGKTLLPRTNPVRQCRDLVNSPQYLLHGGSARTVVDLAVQEDPYYEYERALLQTAVSGLNNGGQSRSRRQRILQSFRTPATDGWETWRTNLNAGLVVPAAVASLSTIMEQLRYCYQKPVSDGTFQQTPTDTFWHRWVSAPDSDWQPS